MKSSNKILWIILAVVVVLVGFGGCQYNSLMTKDEAVNQVWGDLQSSYQRRADLIPNLVSTVKGYAKHESTTLENVIAARAKASQITLDPSQCNSRTTCCLPECARTTLASTRQTHDAARAISRLESQ